MNPPAGPRPNDRRSRLAEALAPFASLRFTLALLGFSLVLIFAATLDQVNLGIWTVQEKYFRSFAVFARAGHLTVPLFPGGYTIGGLLLLNLVAALTTRLAWTSRRSGLVLVHSGLILLLAGELASGWWQRDFSVRLTVGETRSFAESPRDFELALTDTGDPAFNEVIAVPEALLAAKTPVQHPRLPFRVSTRAHYPNSSLHPRTGDSPGLASAGIGREVDAAPRPPAAGRKERNTPSAYVELAGPEGSLGIWLVSPLLTGEQEFSHAGRVWRIALRPRRLKLPHSLTLLEFGHDRHPGTEIPRNLSSRLLVRDGGGEGPGHEVVVSMNHPLRQGGLAHYQAGFADHDRTSILHVVRNPVRLAPYLAGGMMTTGLLLEFGCQLTAFTSRRKRRSVVPSAGPAITLPAADRTAATVLLAAALLTALTLRAPRDLGAFDLTGFGRLPVLANGRVKPLDTVARTSLLLTQGRQRVEDADGRETAPTAWLLDVLYRPERDEHAPVFAVTHPDLLALLRLEPAAGAGGPRYSLGQLRPHLGEADRQARLAEAVEPAGRTTFQRAVLQLRQAVAVHQGIRMSGGAIGAEGGLDRLGAAAAKGGAPAPREAEGLARALGVAAELASLYPTPPAPGEAPGKWRKLPAAWREGIALGAMDPVARAHAELGRAWRAADAGAFNAAVGQLHTLLESRLPGTSLRLSAETRFNAAQPFHTGMVLFVAALLAAALSWLWWPETLGRIALGLLAIAFVLTTAGVGARMWLEARPPVTNLYSSALFVGWGAVAICLVLEQLHRRALAAAAGGLMGFGTMLIAHHLSLGGDTLEMMRAVLDSNFWLATHVVAITAGYSATLLAGFLGLVHIGRALCRRGFDAATADALSRMIQGVTAFALLGNVAGTMLGGIWADQSWGRFWGWDPKENGALLIVLWNAIMLHARAAGLARGRGLAALAVLGNVVTAWSWFGVNMLGVGLHTYGFMGAGFWWLTGFAVTHVLAAACAFLPSVRMEGAPVPAETPDPPAAAPPGRPEDRRDRGTPAEMGATGLPVRGEGSPQPPATTSGRTRAPARTLSPG